ncbi:unnamed protein product [Onchocerca ochengi]|uniref:ATP-dependent DNA helicase n=1 Tax=Onchocerca ochengi TaxID=42157 RepID=A0A182E4Z6_ONCOC|nr:unnamed protein product [Onchocerca ochengi]
MPSDTHKIVIYADNTPVGEHVRRFNAPTINEMAIIIVGDQFQPKDIVIHRRNDQLIKIAETHRRNDTLQYPIIFWNGANECRFSIVMISPISGEETNKKCSAVNYHSYRLMIRENEENHILKVSSIYHGYVCKNRNRTFDIHPFESDQDECTMAHKKPGKDLDQSLQNLHGNTRPFGNSLMSFADFRQTLRIIPRSTSANQIIVCLKYSSLWRHLKTLKLTTNRRVQLQNSRSTGIFSHQLLKIRDGNVPIDLTSGRISLSHNFCNLVASKKKELVEKVFPDIQTNYKNHYWLSERAILAAKNKEVDEFSNIIQSNIQSEEVTKKSVDIVMEADEAVNYHTEYLNSLDLPGM